VPELLARSARRLRRLLRLLLVVVAGMWNYHRLPRGPSRAQSAEWLQHVCRRGLHAMDVQLDFSGAIPQSGLVVSNHLSYLDILAFSAALPCVFVSKAEVARLPVFGKIATRAGTVYVRRERKGDAARANIGIAECLASGVPVALFPEGTTTDGSHVLRFHSTMLQPAIDAAAPVTPCAIRYEVEDGDAALEVCWWGEMKVLPHVWNLLGKKAIRARIAFGEPITASGERKQFANVLREQVSRLHQRLMATVRP
jgi:1-acyl-sn-glycerol-3-phosphate acyltransferase